MRRELLLSCWIIALAAAPSGAPAQTAYEISPARGKIELNVYKEGFFKAFGHDHTISANRFSGRVLFAPGKPENSSVVLRIDADSLTVLDPGTPEKDRKEVQSTMLGEKVLDAARFPEIHFESSKVSVTSAAPNSWQASVSGPLQIHGVTKEVTIPVMLQLLGGELFATGSVNILQSDFGIAPVKAGGGAVKVKDRLRIRFEMHARPRPS